MDENRKKLYDQLSANYDMGTFDEFDSDLDNEDNQKVAWEAMGGQDGYGDFSMFQQAIQRSPQAAEAGNTETTGTTETTGSADAPTEADAAPMMEAQQPDWATTASAMPGEDDADADISLPDAPNPNTPKDASAVSDGKTENTPDAVSDHAEDYSTKSVEELKSNIGVPADKDVTQHDIDSRVTYIESIVDPVQKQVEYDKLMQSLNGLNRYAQAERDAERVVQSIPAEAKVAQHAESVDPAWAKRDEAYGRLVRDGVDYEGKKAPSAAQRGIAKNPKLYNDNIMRVRQMSDDELRRGYATVMDSTAYGADDERRAVDAVPYIVEMNARANGGHAQTMGEEVAKEYLAQHPELKEAYNHWKSGDEGYRSDIDKDPAAAIEVAPFAIADRVLSKIDRRINEINKSYTDEITPDPRKPIPGGVLRDPSGAQLSAMQRRIYDLAEVGNLTRMIQDAFKSYDPVLLNSYIAAFAEKENTDIPSAKKAVADIVLQKVRAEILSRMTPENNAAYASYALFGNTFAANILKAGLALMTSKPGETTIFGLEDEALANYGATHKHWWDQVVRGAVAVGTLAIDAETIGFSGPSFLSGLAGRVVANRASNVFLNRLLTSTISGAVNFGTFEAQTEWVNQLKTGERNIGKIFTRFGGGLAKGAAFGTVNSAVDRLFWNARGWVVPFGEAVKILSETAVFSGIGYLETGKLTAEDLGTNFGMVMSGKVKDPVGYIRDVQARMEGKRYLPKINRISKEYAETLSQKGYSIISSILRTGRVGREQLIGLDGELNKMRSDNTVPWETLRMAEYALDGRLYPSPPATKVKIERGEDSAWTFTPTDNDGRAVGESITVKGTEAKKVLGAKFAHEIEKNNLLIKETASWDASVCREVGKAVLEYCKDNVDGDATSVYKIFMTAHAKHTAGVKLGDVEREIYFGVNARLKDVVPTDDVSVYKAESKRAGYDLDRIVRKPADERSEPERIALKNYIQWLDGREVDARDLNEYDFKEWAERAPEVAAENSARIAKEFEEKADEFHAHLEDLSGKMDLGNVVVLEHVDQVADASVKEQIERSERMGEKGVPGWYDADTDTTYVYLPHNENIEDLDRTIMHEQVSHHGLRVLRTQSYNDLCDRVWNSMSDAERTRWMNYQGVRGIKDQTQRQRAAADEYIAHLAERTDPENEGRWKSFVANAKEQMRKFGIRTDRISDAELERVIRESYRNLREGRDGGAANGTAEAERGNEAALDTEGEAPREDTAEPTTEEVIAPTETVETPPTAESEPPVVESEPQVERPTSAVGRVEGTPADMNDWAELLAENDAASLPVEEVQAGLELMEREREQAHRYAAGELAEEPSDWEYWAARDGLIEPTRQAEPVATEPPVAETPKEPVVETESQHTEPVATEAPTETAQRDTKLPKGADAEAETMEPSELPMTEHIAKMTDAWGDVTRVEVVGQNDNGTTRVRLWFKNRDQRGVEADVDLRGPQPPETPTPPTEPTGDATTADTTTESPAEATGSADDRQMNDVLSAKLGEVDEDAERRAAQEADPYYMPMENKGGGRMSPNYRKATAEQIFNHLNDRENASGRDTLDGNIADGVKRAEDKVKDVERREPKGKGRSDKSLTKWEKELTDARAQLEKWREVERMRREQKAAEGDDSDPTWKQAYDEFNSSYEEPVNLEDYVARHLYGTKFKWKDKEFVRLGGRTHGLGGHLGLSKSDKERRAFFGWIDEKNGSYPESVAEGLYANMPDWMRERYDTMEILDAVLNVVGSNPRPRDMVVDYVKRLREQNRDMDEYYADEAAGARGFHDAGEMDAYDNMREREAAGFHDVAAAGREADGARADLIADAQARLNDPNASEYEKQAARTVLRYRQRDGRDGVTAQGTEGDGVRFRVRDDERRPTFYSNAERAVENVKQGKATAEQWKAMLTKAGGIKAGEDKWMGLTDWLDEHKGQSLTKDEVLQFVRDNGIRIEEVNYGGDIYSNPRMQELQAEYRSIYDNLKAQRSAAYDEAAAFNNKMVEKYGTEAWHSLLDEGDKAQHQQMVDDFERKFGAGLDDAAMREMTHRYGDDFASGFDGVIGNLRVGYGFDGIPVDEAKHYLGDINPIESTRELYTTRGLANKREIAFVVPGIEPYQQHDEIHFGPENGGRAVMWVRFGETTDADGNRVLVIDEIQSNRHQDAREKGYREPAIKQRLDKAQKEYSDYGDMLVKKYNVPKKDVWDSANAEERQKIRELRNALTHAEREYRDNYGIHSDLIPAAPFEKNWHEVAMKRMLRLAADEGFDKVAWTTGAQQSKRYNLGGKVDSIYIGQSREGADKYNVTTYDADANAIPAASGHYTEGEMEQLFGKGITRQLIDGLNEQGERIGNRYLQYHVDGVDLDVGGEGMKGFYDEMLPRFMNKYGKKWGTKVGEVELSTPGREVMHSVDVTPEMKESVEQGQPLFRVRRAPNGKESNLDERQYNEVRTGNFKRWFGDWENDPEEASKVVDANGEPLVVYHQTNRKQYINRKTGQNWDDLDWREREEWDRRSDEEWNDTWEEQDFYTFDNRHARQSVEYPGFFFSPRYDEYHEYGDRTIAAYLDMKNPAIDPDIPNAGVTDTAGRDAMESLMRQGYDGVIRTEDGVPYEYIVFRPEQIKSATENNGDFSRENGDIRFRARGEHETGDRVRVRREGMNDGRVRVDGLPGEWHNIDEAGRAMRLADPEHLYVPSDDGNWLEVHDWRDNEVWDIWRGKPGSKRFEKWRERTLKHIHQQVPEYAKKLGLDVELIEDEAAVPAGHEREKSWRDPKTGKIYIVVPRHAAFDVSDVMSSLWHEGVSRHGLRKLVGGDNYDTFLDNVYAESDANIRAEIDRLTKEVTDGDRRSATEEYLSRLAEQMGFQYYKDGSVPVRSWMQRGLKVMRENFDKLCRYLGMADITATLRDDDLRAVLYDSYNHLLAENRDAYAAAKRAEREDKEYVKAVKRGDIDTAMTMLHRKLAASEGIVGYAAAHGHGGSHREVSHRLKDSESGAIEQAARDMAQYVPKDAVLVPMPPHEGVVRKDTDTWLLAQELSRLTGAPVVAALRGRERESRYAAKQAGRKGLSADELGFYQDMELPDGKTPVFVDNVVGSGETAKAAVQAMGGRGMTLAYTKGNLGKSTEGLKNVTVTYDDAGNLIPLSERFDRSNSDVRFRVRDGRHGSAGIEGPRGEHEAAVEEARRRLESDDASEFERAAARAVIKAYGGSDDAPDTPDGGVRFRTRDDADMLVDMAKRNNEVARQRRDAVTDFVKAITDVDELTDSKFATALGKVMRGQRQYDQATVADITTMVKAMMDAGLLTELDNFSVKQILTKVKDSTGKNDITAEANKLIDIMLKHQLRRGKRAFEQQLKVKGMRQDSRGVVVQGGLDYHGQRAAKALKEGLSLGDLQAVNDRIDEAEQRLSDPDEVVRGNAADELEGLYIARQYYDEIKQSEINEANIKSQLEQAQSDHKNGTLSDEAYKQLRQASNDALRELRCERVDAWARLNEQLSDRQSESAERAKQFREQQKQRQAEIQHWANSDMEGHSADPHEQETQKKSAGDKARDVAQAVLQPLGTFDKLMRYFGNSHPKGEGYLFGFVRRFMNVRDQWFKERKADFDQMDTAARRIGAAHGALVKVTVAGGKIATHPIKDWADVYTYINQQKPLTVTVKGKDYEITQGNAAYLLAMEGQADGRMKLRTMGLTEADMDALRGQVDPMLLELSDWVIHGLLPGMRPRLNATHLRMFGADMTDIPNYFPIRTSELARNETVNIAQQNGKIRPATITGSIIERKRNNLDLDLGADFFQVTAEHIDEMNHWNSFAEFARDLNTLLSYKRFKAQVHNLHSWRYGNGADIWKTLEDTAAITTGDYQPKTSKADTIINGATKGLAAANITFRPYTGLKQLLSAPVYLVQARWDDIGYAIANLKGTWQWAIKNLPTFAERWQGRMAGDPILTQAEQERGSQNKKLRWLSKAGFAFNAAVDATTVAIGARAIYRTKYRRYKDMGYSDEQANQKALEDASISVNETQQSGLGAFTSVIQQDRTFWSRALTIYRNASMGYQRQLAEGMKAMRNGVSAEWRATAREKVQKKLERDGIDPAMAAKVADRLANREAMRGLALAAMFGSIAPFVWALGAQYLGYKMAGGDDDEQEDKMLGQASTHLLSGWLEGIVFGGQISSAADFAYDYFHGRKKLRDYSLQRDLVSDMAEQILGKSSGKPADAVYDIVNMIVAMSTGVNPKSIVEPTVGIIDVVQNWGGDAKLAHEVALGWCRLLNVPQTSLDQVYVDEIGLSAKDAKQLSAEEFAERWCRYKRRRGAGWMSPLTSDESDKEQEGKLLKRYERMMDERFENLSDERIEQIMESDDELLKKHAVKAYKSRIDALSDDEVAAAVVPLSDSAPQDSVDVKREGIKRAYKSEGLSYRKPNDDAKNALAYERHATYDDIAEDTALKGRKDALKKSVGETFEKMGVKYKKGSAGWDWYAEDDASASIDEIKAYYQSHKAELDEYGILLWWFDDSKGSSGYIKKGFTDGKHDPDEVMKEYRETRKEVLAKTKQR